MLAISTANDAIDQPPRIAADLDDCDHDFVQRQASVFATPPGRAP